ncbi:ferric reductase like transmembrane component-domain-containing protein [Fomitopsis serialis]|uniref:ferric reductase like transmembrane component-domain-containing protein n=1 Tax=Fomitopsis serialis TaxID=139415 RepID=UPI002007C805|nr:ferric reductase like transmembrane component-domain-containing protein [Neoantrodia serialis]KAH9928078.1 ferric reductase like transmembrane component-domain-containing protein [Neoantrodia serialis]
MAQRKAGGRVLIRRDAGSSVSPVFAAGFLLLPQNVWADPTYSKPELCAQSCYEALSVLTFSDVSATDTYVGGFCHSTLAVSSIYACFDAYCSQYTADESFGYMNWYCTEYGLSPLSVGYVAEVNTTVIPVQEYVDLARDTLAIWQHQMYVHHSFGWSMYVLAVGVVLCGVANRIFAFIVHRTIARSSPLVDAESAKGGKPVSPIEVSSPRSTICGRSASRSPRHSATDTASRGRSARSRPASVHLVFVYVALNFIFCAIDYHTFEGNTYWTNPPSQLARYLADRTGIIAYANLPLLWLLAGRNDLLLWLTGWSFSTFNVFHRYVARVATVEAIAHSFGYTAFSYITYGNNWEEYKEELKEQYYATGIGATVLMSVLVGLSMQPVRRYCYEFFLATHVIFSIAIIVLLFYHTKIFDGEYDGYLWPCVGFWIFDRAIRLVRIALLNWRVLSVKDDRLRRNKATAVYDPEGDIIRMTVRPSANFCVGAGVHYYIYTPTLSFMFWENHPFTLSAWRSIPAHADAEAGAGVEEIEGIQQIPPHNISDAAGSSTDSKEGSIVSQTGVGAPVSGSSQEELVFIIRPYKGMTKGLKNLLLKAPGHKKDLAVLLEGPYGTKADLASYERTLMISGGSGVTGITSYLCEQGARANGRHTRFVWAAREESFVSDVLEKDLAPFVDRDDLTLDLYLTRSNAQSAGQDKTAGVEATIAKLSSRSGSANGPRVTYARPDVAELLDYEIGQLMTRESRLSVVVCGPGHLADNVRREVVRSIGAKIDASRIELYEESFGW